MAYKVKFDTGQIVEFQKMPTDADIEDVVKNLGISPKKAEKLEESITIDSGKKGVEGFGTGIAKGLGSTAVGLGQIVLKGASFIPGLKKTAEMGIRTGEELKENELKPKGISEKIGFTGEQIGEFLVPTGLQTKALGLLSKAIPSIDKSTKISSGLAKLLVKSSTEATEFGGKTLLQTGGNIGEAIDSAFIGFVSPPILGAAGKVGKAITKTLPEKLYSQIFKTAEDDLLKYYQTVAKGKDINPTLAKEVLDRGLKGNSKNMAVYSIKKLDELESAVSNLVKEKGLEGTKINLDNKNGYENILKTVKEQFKNGFLSNRAKEANVLLKELQSNKTKQISVDTGLKMRRFIDRMRNTSSFRLDPKLTPRQEEFKFATDSLRKKISDIGLGDLMNEERIFIEAISSITSDAARRNNKQLLNLTDVILGGGGLASGFPGAGLGTAATVRAFQQPFTLTNLGQILFKSGNAIESIIPFLEQLPKTIPPTIRQ